MADSHTVLVLGSLATDDALVESLRDEYNVMAEDATDAPLPTFDLCVADHDALDSYHHTILERKHDAGGVFLPCLFIREDENASVPDWELAVADDVLSKPFEPTEVSTHIASLLDHRARTVDFAEEKRQELRQQEALTDAAIEALPDLFYVFEPDGSLRKWNKKAQSITGYDDDELAKMHSLDFLPRSERERVAGYVMTVLEAGDTRTFEVPLVTRTGETIPYEFNVAPLYDHEKTLVGGVGVGRNIADREARRELTRQNERLEKFASIVSHDLRNPIAVANGFLDLASQECDSPHLGRVEDAIGRMEALIDDLLALARQGMTVDEPEVLRLEACANAAWANVDSGSATLVIDTDDSFFADPSRLRQLLENLFRNAVEHAGTDATVTVGDTLEGFYVADDGPGIPADQREGVFEYGYTTSEAGNGFGLAIVQQIAEAHGWSVSVTEGASGGACFEFENVERAVSNEQPTD